MIYIIVGLSILVVIFGYLAFKMRLNHKLMAKMSDEDLKLNTAKLAEKLRNPKSYGAAPQILSVRKQINNIYRLISNKIKDDKEIYLYEKLIYENYHNIMSRFNNQNFKYFAILPHNYGKVRIILLAEYIINNTQCDINKNNIKAIVNKFNEYTPLSTAEISALPQALLYALVCKTAHIAKKSKSLAYYEKVAKKYDFSKDLANVDDYLYFLSKFGKLNDNKKFTEDYSGNLDNIQYIFTEKLAHDFEITANIISSLNFIKKDLDGIYLLSINHTNNMLEQDELYKSMDIISKNDYLNTIEEVSNKHKIEEQAVVKKLFELQAQTSGHFGKYLYEEKETLKHYINSGVILTYKKGTKIKETYFILAVWAITLAITALFGFLTSSNLAVMIVTLIISPFFLLPLINNLLITILSITLKQKPTPKLNLQELPDNAKTMVILPTFIADEKAAMSAVNKIKELQSSNKGKNISFALLIDYKKSKYEKDVSDCDLNKKISSKLIGFSDINVFVRKRVKQGKVYTAFERKRGAILDLCECLLTENTEKFAYIMREEIQKPTFIATLDDDNCLLPNTIFNSVCRMLHPLNKKYDLMTFKTKYDLYSMNTLYGKRYYFDCGYSRYLPSNSFYYNFFGKGIYCGKGIFRLQEYYTKLNNLFPSNRILSHDIIEGSILKTGELPEVAFENAPNSIPSEIARHNRWFKGDMLLGGFLKNKIKNDKKQVKVLNKPIIYNHIILLNIMGGFAKLGLLISMLISMITGNIWYYIPFAIGFFTQYFVCMLQTIDGTRHNIKPIFVAKNLLAILCDIVISYFTLPIMAINNLLVALDTIICRMSRKSDRLSWTTFSQSQAKSGVNNYCKFVVLQCITMLVLSIIYINNIFVVGYSAIFIALAFSLYITSVKQNEKQEITASEKEFLLDLARRTYKYFDIQNSKQLVTDNIQIRPFGGKSHYTSPTNLGFSILSEICAAELSIISMVDAERKLIDKLNLLDNLEKYHGNFYNWYNVETNEPAYPFYISSVDNGNMLACLIVAKQFIIKHSLYGIDIISKLIDSINLEVLLDKNKNLFHIGYNVKTNTFDNYYDLMASEARILYYLYAAFYQNATPWDNLSRDCVGFGGNTLVSWSGTMFEYLLPNIFIRAPKNSLLYQTESNVVKLSVKNKCQNIWGISESGYYKFDDNLRYQYYSFGMQELAIRNSHNRCVIAPYASALALRINVKEAVKNLINIKKECGMGEYGFYEAIDITSRKHIIYQYMSHHQGMILASITNAICGNNISEYFESDAQINATKILLSEKTIQERSFKKPKDDFVYDKFDGTNYRTEDKNAIGVLTNGKYTAFYNSFGDNLSSISNNNICKYHNTFEDFGFKNSIYDLDNNSELKYYPTYNNSQDFAFVADCEKVLYANTKCGIVEEIYIPNCINGEVHKFDINCKNLNNINVRGYGEINLQSEDDFIAHPAFKDMFVSSKKFDDCTIIYKRKADVNKYLAVRIIGLEKVILESNKSNCVNATDGKFVFNEKEFDNSFGDIVYPIFTYNGNVDTSKLDNFEYYQIIMYAESYSELTNKLSQIHDKKAVYNLIYSAKLPTLSAIRKIFDSNSNYDFLTKLAYKLKYGKYNQNNLINKENEEIINQLSAYGITANDNVIYFNTLDSNLFKLLLKCLRILKPLVGEFTVFCNSRLEGIYKVIREQYFDIKVIFEKNNEIADCARKISFIILNSEVIINSNVEKSLKITDITSNHVDIQQFDLQDNYGGFEGKNYILTKPTQKPFSNVISGKYGGFVACNNGENFTFFGNSRNDKVTEWRGEAYSKIDSEMLTIYSENKCWVLNKFAEGGFVKYGQGFIDFVMSYNGFYTNCMSTVVDDGISKVYILNIKNLREYQQTAKFDLTLKLALGVNREKRNIYIDTKENICEMKNVISKQKAYIRILDNDIYSYLDENCNLHTQISADFEQGESKQIYLILSQDKESILSYNKDNIGDKIKVTLDNFDNLNKIKIITENKELDCLFNNWLMYQTYSARLCGKCGYYQVGGAIGFRDQLQDCLAYLYTNPEYVKNHILLSAERQFIEGDVLHWWHGYAEGVRTKISDDKLFLPFVVTEYIKFTGDKDILDITVPYLKSEKIPANQRDLYKSFERGSKKETLYMHCLRAFENALKYGENELLMIGEGDWNDALNNIGNDKKGESVWLSMFCYYAINQFSDYFKNEDKEFYSENLLKLKKGIDKAYNGNWYNRAFTKDGEWLGNEDCDSCKIDLISQAFAAICDGCDKEKAAKSLVFAMTLADKDNNLVKLLAPPFNDKKYYGYISNYPEGVRENGGQYTHSVAWFIKALAKYDMEKAIEILNLINPINISRTSLKYKNEPFVLSGDVYMTGEGGWSWYSGSSSWMYKVILNDILGINFNNNKLIIKPNKLLNDYKVQLKFDNFSANIKIVISDNDSFIVDNKAINFTDNLYFVDLADNQHYEIIINVKKQ